MVFVFIVVVSICVILIIQWLSRRHKVIKCLEKFDGPPPLPIVGNMLQFSPRTELLSNLLKFTENYGPTVKLWIGPTPSILLIQDYKFLEFITNSSITLAKSDDYKYLKGWIGDGLLTNSGDARWLKFRKILTPVFHYSVLEKLIPVITSVCDILVNKLENAVGNPSFDISNIMKLYTLDSICECVMGTAINAQENVDCKFLENVEIICNILIQRMFNPLLKPEFLFRFSNLYHKQQTGFKILNDMVDTVIRKRKAEMQKIVESKTLTDDDDEYGKKRRLLFVDLLLEAAAKDPSVTDKHIREEVATFLFAGHDTTQVALTFCLYSLAENQDVQKKVVKELDELFGNDMERLITLQNLNKMKYMEAVIKETLRLYPPVPFHSRRTIADVEYDGLNIPKGITLVMFPFGLHRDPKLYSNPLKFDPDRFITGGEPKHSCAYLPFSAGSRDCIGRKFAMIEIKLTLATLLRKYKFYPANPKHELLLFSEVVLTSQTGVRIQIQKRHF